VSRKNDNTTASEISGSPEEISWSPEGALELAEGAIVDDMVDGYIRGFG